MRASVPFLVMSLFAASIRAETAKNCTEAFDHARALSQAGSFTEAERLLRGAAACFQTSGPALTLANFQTELAIVLRERGKIAEALTLFESALRNFQKDPSSKPANFASALNNLGSVYQISGNPEKAESLYLEAIGQWKQSDAAANGYAKTLTNLASIASAKGDYRRAETLLLQARSAGGDLNNPEQAGTLNQLGVLYDRLGRPEAEALLRGSLALRQELSGPKSVETSVVMNNLGHLLDGQRRFTEAEALMRQAYSICFSALGASPRCASMLNNLASIEEKTGRPVEAEAHWTQTVALFGAAPEGNVIPLSAAFNNLGKLCFSSRKYREAGRFYARALAVSQGPISLDKASVLTNLGALHIQQGRLARADDELEQALAMDQAIVGREHGRVATDLNNLGVLAVKRKRYAEAEDLFRRALAIDEKRSGPQSRPVAGRLSNLAELKISQKRFGEAATLFAQAFAIWGQDTGMAPSAEISVLQEYANSLKQIQDYAGAERVEVRAMNLRVHTAIRTRDPADYNSLR